MELKSIESEFEDNNSMTIAGDFIWTKNVTGHNQDNSGPVDGGIYDQTIAALDNIDTLLKSVGSSLENAIKLSVYVRFRQDYDLVNKALKDKISSYKCVYNFIFTSAMVDPRFSVEIDAVALKQ